MAKLKMHDSIKARGLRIMGTPFEERGYKMLHEVKRKPKATGRDADPRRVLPLNSYAWQKLRASVIQLHPICPECEIVGKVVPSVDVDHIDGNPGNNDFSNLVGLCKTHHSRKSWYESRGLPYFAPVLHPYNLMPAIGEVTIICGPAGSGKTTLANQLAEPGDLILDLDVLRNENGGSLEKALKARNRLLHSLATRSIRAYFIISAPLESERDWWGRKLVANDIRVLSVPLNECISRIKSTRHGQHQKSSIHAATKWWAEYESQKPMAEQPSTLGCDASGMPINPEHHWNTTTPAVNTSGQPWGWTVAELLKHCERHTAPDRPVQPLFIACCIKNRQS